MSYAELTVPAGGVKANMTEGAKSITLILQKYVRILLGLAGLAILVAVLTGRGHQGGNAVEGVLILGIFAISVSMLLIAWHLGNHRKLDRTFRNETS